MYEIDFLAVGSASKSGDAICLRYTNPEGPGYITGIVDAGFIDNGDDVVAFVKRWYATNSVDFVLSTHPDEDHIGGLGKVMRGLRVANLLIHRPALHGFPNNSGAQPSEELTALAERHGTRVIEPFTGVRGFGGSLLVAGPTENFYREKLREQEQTVKRGAGARPSLAQRYLGTIPTIVRKVVAGAFPIEIFFDDAGGDNPRNNSAAILSLMIDGRHMILPSDAGVPAIAASMKYLDRQGRTANYPDLFALPHHGGRHNFDRDTANRILGDHTRERRGTAVASVATESERPSPRVANAAGRRGYPVYETRGNALRHSSADAPARAGWTPKTPLSPLVEDDHD